MEWFIIVFVNAPESIVKRVYNGGWLYTVYTISRQLWYKDIARDWSNYI